MIIGTFPPRAFSPETCLLAGSFQTNGSTSGNLPASSISVDRGLSAITVSGDGTGIYTVTYEYGTSFPSTPLTLVTSPQCAALTNYFSTIVLGGATNTSGQLSFVIQCHRAGTANAPPNTANSRINFWLVAVNSTGA